MKLFLAPLVVCLCISVGDAQSPQPVTKVMFFDQTKTAEVFAKGGPLLTASDMIVPGASQLLRRNSREALTT